MSSRTRSLSLSLAVAAALAAPASAVAGDYEVRVVYFVPANRTPAVDYQPKLQAAIGLLRDFFAGQTGGKTFRFESDDEGKPVVHLVVGTDDDAHYREDLYGRVVPEATAGLASEKTLIVIYTETQFIDEDGALAGTISVGGSGNYVPGGGWDGVAFLGADLLWHDYPAALADTGDYQALFGVTSIPAWMGTEEQCERASTRFTVAKHAGISLGVSAHEIGHAFGLNHALSWQSRDAGAVQVARLDSGYRRLLDVDALSIGYLYFRGAIGADNCGDGDAATRLNTHDLAVLDVNRYFNPDVTYDDDEAPTVTITAPESGSVSASNMVPVTVQASDAGSGLHYVTFWTDGSLVDGVALTGAEAAVTRTIFVGTTTPGDLPSLTKHINARVWDAQGTSLVSSELVVTLTNHEPTTPSKPAGPKGGLSGDSYSFATMSDDIEDQHVHYVFDWGDGTVSESEPGDAGVSTTVAHVFSTEGVMTVRVKAVDEVGGESLWSEPAFITIGEGMVPWEIGDLAATAEGDSALLAWTAPGDGDAMGTSGGYQLRYAEGSYSEEAWAAAPTVSGVAAPQAAGATESFTVEGLSPGTYWFAIEAYDPAGNPGPRSNIATVTIDGDAGCGCSSPGAPGGAAPALLLLAVALWRALVLGRAGRE